ncbi:MAG: EF-P 5-aminopentanol modification-associated protein YfmH [Bacilli bacterium]
MKNNIDLNKLLIHKKLKSGLDVYLFPNKNISSSYFTLTTRYGGKDIIFSTSKNKNKTPIGMAHFLEHKVFEMENGEDAFNIFSENGASANAMTSHNKTKYLFKTSINLENNLRNLINFVYSPFFTEENVKKEQGIISEEIDMINNKPDYILYREIINSVFEKNPITHSNIGSKEDIKQVTKEDLDLCFDTFYNPSNMFLVGTGNFDIKEVLNIIEDEMSKLKFKKYKPINLEKFNEPKRVFLSYKEVNEKIEIPKIAYSIKFKYSDFKFDKKKTKFYLNIILDLLFSSTSDFLEELIKEKIITQELYTFIESNEDDGFLSIICTTKTGDQLIQKIDKLLENPKIYKDKFLKLINGTKGSFIKSLDNIVSVNNNLSNQIFLYNSCDLNFIKFLNSLSFEEIEYILKTIDFTNKAIVIMKKEDLSNITNNNI